MKNLSGIYFGKLSVFFIEVSVVDGVVVDGVVVDGVVVVALSAVVVEEEVVVLDELLSVDIESPVPVVC